MGNYLWTVSLTYSSLSSVASAIWWWFFILYTLLVIIINNCALCNAQLHICSSPSACISFTFFMCSFEAIESALFTLSHCSYQYCEHCQYFQYHRYSIHPKEGVKHIISHWMAACWVCLSIGNTHLHLICEKNIMMAVVMTIDDEYDNFSLTQRG